MSARARKASLRPLRCLRALASFRTRSCFAACCRSIPPGGSVSMPRCARRRRASARLATYARALRTGPPAQWEMALVRRLRSIAIWRPAHGVTKAIGASADRLPQILDPHGLALRARHLAGRLHRDLAGYTNERLDMGGDLGSLAGTVGVKHRDVRRQLDLDRHGIKRALARQHDLIMRREVRQIDQHGLDLRRIDVDAADDEHVIVAPGHAHDADMGASTRARLMAEPRDVACAIADHRQRLLGERGNDELASLADGTWRKRLRIDYLEQEMILPAVQAG